MPPALACLLLAAGASALNQCQERDLDPPHGAHADPAAGGQGIARRRRRRDRGASRRGRPGAALGSRRLATVRGRAGALCWYHAVYTPLKRRTPFAAIRARSSGRSAPRSAGSPRAGIRGIRVSRPHGALLTSGRCRTSGSWPCVTSRIIGATRFPLGSRCPSPAGLGRVTFAWTIAAATAGMMLPLFGLIRSPGLYLVLGAASLGLAIVAAGLLRFREGRDRLLRRSFAGINLYLLAAMILLLADRGLQPARVPAGGRPPPVIAGRRSRESDVTGILGKLILLPSVQQWHLLDVLGAAMLFFFLSFAGALLFCHALSLLFRRSRPDARARTGRAPGAASRRLVRLRSPPAGRCCVILESQRFYGTPSPIGVYLLRVLGLGAVAFACLHLHARRRHPLLGSRGSCSSPGRSSIS